MVADSVPDARALLVFEADCDVGRRQHVDVAEGDKVVVVVPDDAVHHLVGVEKARREKDRPRSLGDQLRRDDVCVESVVVELEGVNSPRVGVLVDSADGYRRHPRSVERVLVEEAELRADVVLVDRPVAVLPRVDEFVAGRELEAVCDGERGAEGTPVDVGVIEVDVPRAELRLRDDVV